MKFRGTCFLLIILALAMNAYAQLPGDLGTAATFGALAGSGVMNNGGAGTTIAGNVGSSPTVAITGLLASQVSGTLYTAPSAFVAGAKNDLITGYNTAAGAPCPGGSNDITGVNLGTMSLTGTGGLDVYCSTSGVGLTGTLTLIGGPSDVFVFQAVSTLITGTNSTVILQGVSPCNVFWQVGSSAVIFGNNNFVGTIMALTSITLDGGNLNGRALARNGAVTIATQETITNGCSSTPSVVLTPAISSIVCQSGTSITKTAIVLSNGLPVYNTPVLFTITGPDSSQSTTINTDASGIAALTITNPQLTALLGDTIVATINSGTITSNTTFATCSGSVTSVCRDTTKLPTATLVNVIAGPPTQAIFSVQALAGLLSVTATGTNDTFVIPTVINGSTLALSVVASKTNQSLSATVKLTVTDLCNHVFVLDPVFTTITIPGSKSKGAQLDFDHREVDRFNGIGHTEGIVTLHNDTPGVDSLVIRVNGSQFRTQLSDGERKTIDISSALFHGHNTVTVAAIGDPGSSVDLTISD